MSTNSRHRPDSLRAAVIAPPEAAPPRARLRSAGRIVGVDIARCLALLGMMATHILPGTDPADGSVTWVHEIAGGRSSALFAVLAGVSLALVTGRGTPMRGKALASARVSIAVRATLIALIGLGLGELDSGVAVILTYYGVLFLLAFPFLGWGPRRLAALALVWAVAAPIASHLLRGEVRESTYGLPAFERLAEDPARLLLELTFTGYYPAVPWLAYVLAGLALGRLTLSSPRVAGAIAAIGGGLAVAALSLSALLVAAGRGTLEAAARAAGSSGLDELLAGGTYGVTPTNTAWWLVTDARHSATPLDLLHTTGTAMLVLGLALLAGQAAPRLLARVFAAGTMTLTLYTAHVLALALLTEKGIGPERGTQLYAVHAVAALVLAALWAAAFGSGPLERLTTSGSRAAARVLVRPAPARGSG